MAFTSALPSSSKIFDPDLEDRVQDQVTAKDLTSDSSVFRGSTKMSSNEFWTLEHFSCKEASFLLKAIEANTLPSKSGNVPRQADDAHRQNPHIPR
ncbi:unnamed protein product [Sphagnum balticum]